MKVVCIKDFKSQALQLELTYGKSYEVLDAPNWVDDKSYFIECDMGFLSSYNKNSFISLDEWREKQLNKIL